MADFKNTIPGILCLGVISSLIAAYILAKLGEGGKSFARMFVVILCLAIATYDLARVKRIP